MIIHWNKKLALVLLASSARGGGFAQKHHSTRNLLEPEEQVDFACPCVKEPEDWEDHGEYVSCVAHEVQYLPDLDETRAGEIISARATSDCGKENGICQKAGARLCGSEINCEELGRSFCCGLPPVIIGVVEEPIYHSSCCSNAPPMTLYFVDLPEATSDVKVYTYVQGDFGGNDNQDLEYASFLTEDDLEISNSLQFTTPGDCKANYEMGDSTLQKDAFNALNAEGLFLVNVVYGPLVGGDCNPAVENNPDFDCDDEEDYDSRWAPICKGRYNVKVELEYDFEVKPQFLCSHE